MHTQASLPAKLASIVGRFSLTVHALWKRGGSQPQPRLGALKKIFNIDPVADDAVGLAVSGGVDSMAMASLCSETLNTAGPHSSVVGFIVDHKLRNGSTQEAHSVAERLKRLHIEPRILTLDWQQYGDPSTLDHLEQAARILRYQAIGRACRERGIDSLLVAHHADDQAETVLMRFVSKYFGSGLQGIAFEKPIPECQGMYGVHESGSPRSVIRQEHNLGNVGTNMLLEDGGVRIVRPLLPFAKHDLITYCKTANVGWHQDRTNADPTFALRNTLRYLLRNGLLPVALRKQRLLELADKVGEREADAETTAQDEYDRMTMTLNIRTGQATFEVPTLTTMAGATPTNKRRMKAALLRKMLSLAAPTDEIKLQDVYQIVASVLPDAEDVEVKDSGTDPRPPLQMAGVSMYRSYSAASRPSLVIERQRPTRRDIALQRFGFADAVYDVSEARPPFRASDWHLWDRRYWVRITQRTDLSSPGQRPEVTVRFLVEDDITQLMQTLNGTRRSQLRKLLTLAPGSSRFTLPMLEARPVVTPKDGPNTPQIVALPSLGWSAEEWARWPGDEAANKDLDTQWFWDIRYKKIDIGHGKSHEVLANYPTSARPANIPPSIAVS